MDKSINIFKYQEVNGKAQSRIKEGSKVNRAEKWEIKPFRQPDSDMGKSLASKHFLSYLKQFQPFFWSDFDLPLTPVSQLRWINP